jgi:small subunit ribosomal protein S8e
MELGRKISGGRYHQRRKKRFHERIRQERITIIGDTKKKKLRKMGGSLKTILLRTNIANVKAGKSMKKAEIKNVVETPQNKFLARQNRLMKGAIIETSLGRARITNRPAQEGQINAILLEK